jgi:hypothetical protein
MLLILTSHYFQDKHEQESLENLHQMDLILQKNNSLLEQILINDSLECDSLKNATFQLKKELGLFSTKRRLVTKIRLLQNLWKIQ